jgi:hypothetical protein
MTLDSKNTHPRTLLLAIFLVLIAANVVGCLLFFRDSIDPGAKVSNDQTTTTIQNMPQAASSSSTVPMANPEGTIVASSTRKGVFSYQGMQIEYPLGWTIQKRSETS